MSLLEKLRTLIDQLQLIPKALQDLTGAIRSAQKGNPSQDDREIRVRAEVWLADTEKAEQRSAQKEQTSIQRSVRNAAWAAFVAAAIAAGIYSAQLSVMSSQQRFLQQQEDVLVAQTRPWVRVTTLYSPKVVVTDKEARVYFSYKYNNFGNSPATKAMAFFKVRPSLSTTDLMPPLTAKKFMAKIDGRQTCESFHKDMKDALDIAGALFVKQEQPVEGNNLSVPIDDIPDFGPIEGASLFGRPNVHRATTFEIVGCVLYTFAGSAQMHATSFIWTLSGPNNAGIDVSRPGEISGAYLHLTEGISGVFAD